MNGPGDFRDQTCIDQISSFATWNDPASTDHPHALAICSRLDLVRSIGSSDGLSIFHFQKGHEIRIEFFDRRRKARKSMRCRFIVRCRCFRSSYERQCEMQLTLTNDPDSELAARSVSKILKPRNVSQGWAGRKIFDSFPLESFHEFLVGSDHFSEERCSLLPLAFRRDVAIVASSESKDGEQMRLAVEIILQPRPSRIVGCSQLRKWSRSKFCVLAEKSSDLQSVHVTDGPKASSPGVAVAILGQQIPPEFHLLYQRRRNGLNDVLTACELRGIVDCSGVLVGVAIVPACGQRIVRKERPVSELFGGPIEQIIQGGAIFVQPESIVDRRNPRGHAKVIFGKVDERMSFLIVKTTRIKQLPVFFALFDGHPLP